MLTIKKLIILIIFFAICYSQSMINSYGMGNPGLYKDVASTGLSSSGLIPGYGRQFSLMNPSTWSSSKFSIFSSTFMGTTRYVNRENVENQHSNIDLVIFIVPIKQKYAIGVGFFPYADQNVQFNRTDLMTYENGESSLLNQSVDYSGGLSSLRFAFGFPFGNIGLGGWGFDLLFGSTRVHKITDLKDDFYIHDQRKLFNGIISQFYFTSNPFFIDTQEIILYLNLDFTMRNFSAEVQSYQPFIDVNKNGIHDVSLIDFPGIDKSPDPVITQFRNFYNPIEFNFGVNVKYTSDISFMYEGGIWKNTGNTPDELFEFKDGLSKKIYLSQGLIKYAGEFPQNIIHKLHWRTGYSISQMNFQNNSNQVDKFDVSIGMGLPFGKLGNQIDFAVTFSKIKSGNLINETVKSFKIGLTIGDIWFVKRRNR